MSDNSEKKAESKDENSEEKVISKDNSEKKVEEEDGKDQKSDVAAEEGGKAEKEKTSETDLGTKDGDESGSKEFSKSRSKRRSTSRSRSRSKSSKKRRSSRRSRSRSRSRDRHRSRDRRRSRDRHRSRRRSTSRDSRRRRSRSRSRDRRRSRSRSRDRRRSRSRSRERRRRRHRSYSRSRSRSRSRDRKKKKKKHKKKKKKKSKGSRSSSRESGSPSKRAIVQAMLKQNLLQQAKAAETMRQHAAWLVQTKHSRCIYVGGVGHLPQAELHRFWNTVVNKCLSDDTRNPVMSVYMNPMRNFAFVEFDSMTIATCCIDLDGILYNGSPINIRRPKNYNPELAKTCPNPKKTEDDDEVFSRFNVAAVGLKGDGLKTVCEEGPNKIFVGGIPPHLSNSHIQELLESAGGPLKALQMIRNALTGLSKGYGFCEFQDHSKTEKAITDLNGLDLGDGKSLIVKQAGNEVYAPPPGTGLAQSDAVADSLPGSNVPAPAQQDAGGDHPTRIIVLSNMVTEQELRNPVEYNEIRTDIHEECGNYGKVVSFRLPRTNETKTSEHVGKAFVEYSTVEEAEKARKVMEGRAFAQRIIGCKYMSEHDFSILENESLNE